MPTPRFPETGGAEPDVRIGVLGELLVHRGRRPVSISAGASSVVLSVLAIEPAPLPTSELARVLELVGPGRGTRATVHTAMWRLRRALGEDALELDADAGYALNRAVCATDVDLFERTLRRARTEREQGDPVSAAASYADALVLWRGPALRLLARDPSRAAHAVRLEELRVATSEDWAQALQDTGRPVTAARVLERTVAEQPLRERAWALLVSCYLAAGQADDARTSYDRARLRLAEHGLEPGVQLRRSLDPLCARPPTSPAPPAQSRHRDQDGPRLATLAAQGPLVGRAPELRLLQERIERDDGWGAAVVVVSGPAGIGKTRLAAEAALGAYRRGAQVWFQVAEPDEPTPLAPFGTWVRAIARTLGDNRMAELVRGPLGRLLHPAVHGDVAGHAERERGLLYVAMAELVAEVCHRPSVLVVDDLHLTTPDGIGFLVHLLATRPDLPLRVLATVGDPADERSGANLQALWRLPGVGRDVVLGGLGPDATGALVTALARRPEPVDAALTDRIWRATGGRPALVRSLAMHPAALDVFKPSGGPPQPPVALLDEITAQLLEGLATGTRAALEIAAAAAAVRPVPDERALAAAAGLLDWTSPSQLVDGLRAAFRAGLLAADAGRGGHWTFIPGLVRDAVDAGMTAERRAAIHLALASGLQSLLAVDPDPDAIAVLAGHYRRAWPLCPAEEAAGWLRAAGEQALDDGALDRADTAFAHALDLYAGEPVRATDRLRGELWLLAGQARTGAGDSARARAAFLEASRLASETGWDDIAAAAAVGAMETYERGERASAPEMELLRRAAADPAGIDGGLFAEVLGLVSSAEGDGSGEMVDDALGAARRGDGALLAILLERIWWSSAFARRDEIAAELAALGAARGDARAEGHASLFRSVAAMQSGRRGFRDGADDLAAAVRRADNPLLTCEWRVWSATAATSCGRFGDAARHMEAARSVRWRTAGAAAWSPSRSALMGAVDSAQAAQAIYRSRDVDDLRVVTSHAAASSLREWADSRCYQLSVAAFWGDPGTAVLCDRLLDDGLLAHPPGAHWLASASMLADGCAMAAHREGIDRCVEALLPHAGWHALVGIARYYGSVHHHLGLLYSARDEPDRAVEALTLAVDAHDRAGARNWRTLSLHFLARAHRQGGTRSGRLEADRLNREVRAQPADLEMAGLLAALQRASA